MRRYRYVHLALLLLLLLVLDAASAFSSISPINQVGSKQPSTKDCTLPAPPAPSSTITQVPTDRDKSPTFTKKCALPAPPVPSSAIGVVGGGGSVPTGTSTSILPSSPTSQKNQDVDLQSVLLSRRTINDFESDLPAGWEAALAKAVTAATFAPNHKMTEPWRFHLLGPEAIERVCKLNAEIVSERKGPAAGEKKLARWLAMPGWLVVTCVRGDESASMDDPTSLARENYAAVCCAVQNLCLSLHGDGIGTKWTTGPVNFHPSFNAAVGLPENEYVVGTLWFGKAAKFPQAPKKKLSIDDVLIRHE